MQEPKSLQQLIANLLSEDIPTVSWFRPDLFVDVGLDTRTIPSQYYWDGLKRNGDPDHPFLIFQYTLSGWGRYTENDTNYDVTEGKAFTATIPSAHAYYLPPESSNWTFFWILIGHPYLVSRILEIKRRIGPVMALALDDLLLARAVTLVEGVSSQTFRDQWAAELALFDFLIEYERFAQDQLYPQDARTIWLDDVRNTVLQELGRSVTVEELAARKNMSRSHFSHQFKALTGLSPGQWVTQVCLEQATQMLLKTDLKLEAIADKTGFADANHLCKVFRRHFHMSPGKFRQQQS